MPSRWPNEAHSAVSLTFDGATAAQRALREKLDAMDSRATFYADPLGLLEDVSGWQEAVARGHEVGNLALFSATDEDGLIARMSRRAIEEELDETRHLISETFRCPEHSAAMPLVRTLEDDSGVPTVPEVVCRTVIRLNEDALLDPLRARYPVVRSSLGRFNEEPIVLQALRCCRVDGMDAVAIGLTAQIAISQGHWAILSWGPEFDPSVVMQVARWLTHQPVWVAPVIDVARHVGESSALAPTFQSL